MKYWCSIRLKEEEGRKKSQFEMRNSGFVECIKSNYYNDLDLFFSLVSWTFSLMVEKESRLSSLKRTAAKELLCVKDLLIQV